MPRPSGGSGGVTIIISIPQSVSAECFLRSYRVYCIPYDALPAHEKGKLVSPRYVYKAREEI